MILFAPDKGFIGKPALAVRRNRAFAGLLSNITYSYNITYIYLNITYIYNLYL